MKKITFKDIYYTLDFNIIVVYDCKTHEYKYFNDYELEEKVAMKERFVEDIRTAITTYQSKLFKDTLQARSVIVVCLE